MVFFTSTETIITIIIGFSLGLIPFILFTNFDNVKKNKFFELIGVYDPLNQKPIGKGEDNTKHYNSDNDLPPFDEILRIEGLKEIKILSITSYVLLLKYLKNIRNAIENDVEFTFLLLNPKSPHIEVQSKKLIGGTNLKCQIESAIEELCKIKNSIDESKKNKLKIGVYNEEIGESIMIINMERSPRFKRIKRFFRIRQQKSWIKKGIYKKGSDANDRPIITLYKHENERLFKEFSKPYYDILKIADTHTYC
jgi:hypothetical protein